MSDKQSAHNDISPTKLNSIHHKVVINTNRVEGIDSTDYNTSCNCEMRFDVDGDGADVGDDVDDDLDDARDDDDDDGDDLPFREVISPAESPRRRWVLCSVSFHQVEAAYRKSNSSLGVSTPRGLNRRKGAPRGATRHPGGCLARPGGGAATGTLLVAWWVPSPPPSVIPIHSS